MPDYRRLVSYMYTYEDGKKRSNVGYARVEARNGQCKFTIHVSALNYNDKQVTVYAFKRNANVIDGIQLGKFTFRNDAGDFRLVTDPNRILNTAYGIEDIGGIVLYQTNSKYLATVWDDYPLTMDMVASLDLSNVKASNVNATGVLKEEKVAIERSTDEVKLSAEPSTEAVDVVDNEDTSITEKVADSTDNKDMGKVFDITDNNEIEKIVKNVDNSVSEKSGELTVSSVIEDIADKMNKVLEKVVDIVDNNRVEKDIEKIDYIIVEKVAEEIDKEAEKVDNSGIESSTENMNQLADSKVTEEEAKIVMDKDEKVHDLSMGEDSCGCNNSQNAQKERMNQNQSNQYRGNYTTTQSEEVPLAAKLYRDFPRMHPFEDNEVLWCVRIEPKDIALFPVDVWPLANNSFLLHGFYGHRHLIFAKVNNRNNNSYILGVPGIYHNRERFMAKMFGFENFKCAKRRDRREGEFGYWFVPVNLK